MIVSGILTVFEGVIPLITGLMFEDKDGAQKYHGQGAERRERLV